MVEQTEGPGKGKLSGKAAIIAAAVAGLITFTSSREGTVYKAYPDPAKGWDLPTICNGHTRGVYRGQVATKAQCKQYLQDDLNEAALQAVAVTPKLLNNQNALRGTGDFVFNAGIGAYARSPMAPYFAKEQWTQGCNAFVGYRESSVTKTPIKGTVCTYHTGSKNYTCRFPGLVNRRVGEKQLCLTGVDNIQR